ncbi:MAG: tRNA epoxyqueuosine(34) reductase QueG [Planctomyces sp.]|nr:tRNA epoxyqueuosine(34) reductase QueG [Planctomyces sp.]MBA4039409.1 tRNA epoxyqueuosine(34) reductase QueG [Planctomyces sp.]MBA4120571.1 tRNA epoxyqueuosine(34) reductase QueG [Isosphaera sp.]
MSGPDADAHGPRVLAMALQAGFDMAGVCPAGPSGQADRVRAWLDAGMGAAMEWFERDLAARLEPGRLLAGARSALMVAWVYERRSGAGAAAGDGPAAGGDGPAAAGVARARGPVGRVARYARGRDYHRVVKRRLHAIADRLRAEAGGAEFRSFCDIEPVLEREHAARAGLGWVGKNTMLIHPRLGSYFVLGGFLTTMDLGPARCLWRGQGGATERGQPGPVPDHCGTCTRCIDACPTAAITPRGVDAGRCVSYLTIEHRGRIEPALHAGIGAWLFGCDVCQEVCPHNGGGGGASDAGALPLLEVLGWGPRERARGLGVSAMKRATLAMLRRNAAVALGNAAAAPGASESERLAIADRLSAAAHDSAEDPLVRGAAADALGRLGASGGGAPA